MDRGERGDEGIPSIISQDKEEPAARSVFTLQRVRGGWNTLKREHRTLKTELGTPNLF